MIGVGSMGGMMTLLYAEYGTEVHAYDPGTWHYLNDAARSSHT